jgi:hypothetical protein
MKLYNYAWSGFIFLGLLAYTSCSLTGIKGNGNVVKVEQNIEPFSELEFKGVFDVILSQGDKEKLVIEADENLIDIVEIKNEGAKLNIDFKKGKSVKKSTKFNVYVTVKDLITINMSGVGDLKNNGSLNLKTLKLEKTGVGDIDLNVNTMILNVKNSGVGTINLQGTTDHLDIDNSGVGDVHTKTLKANNVKLDNSGVGDVTVYASKKIEISANGVGDLKYYGHPVQKHINNNGVGKVYEK